MEYSMSDIRWMVRRDLKEVIDIENGCFAANTTWTEDDFLITLKKHDCTGIVYEHDGKLVGFLMYELSKTELFIINVAIHPDYQRKGIGTQLINKLVGKLSFDRRTKIKGMVRDNNLDVQLFLKHLGFKAIQVLKNYYEDFNQDGYLMQYKINQNQEAECVI